MFGYGMMRGFGGYGAITGLGIVSLVFQLLVFIAVVVLIIYGIRALTRYSAGPRREYRGRSTDHQHHRGMEDGQGFYGPERSTDPMENALKILAERFAKGEISAEEYQSMKEELKK